MRVDQIFTSNWLRASDLAGRAMKLKIAAVEIEKIGNPPTQKPVVRFVGAKKALVLNKVNSMAIASVIGPEMNDWVGKEVELYPTMVQGVNGGMVDAIRIRVPLPERPPAKQSPELDDAIGF